ncbi:hypothetical protein AB0451_33310 [Streptomyces sp. NPDC052000]|uniref:hypothetical protein n=1 Tax=Streptomyces sp. NPDC052000 TaxID=3155676 RepID=UPI00344E325D
MDSPGNAPHKPDKPREQHNHGQGTFIGGDHHGDIRNEMVDPNTKALLVKMTRQNPALAKLLTKALRDGVISPEIANSLARAARSINEDVAGLISNASRRINEDVASSLMYAGDRINPVVANQLTQAAETLSQAVKGLDLAELARLVSGFEEANASLSSTAREMDRSLSGVAEGIDRLRYPDGPLGRLGTVTGALTEAADRIERTVTPPPPQIVIDRQAQITAFLWGLGIGAAFIFFLWHRSG